MPLGNLTRRSGLIGPIKRRRLSAPRLLAAGWWAIFFVGAVGASDPSLPPPAKITVDFTRDIRPLFEAKCHSCHGTEKQQSGYRLDVRTLAFAGGDTYRAAIIPGDSAGSPLIHLVAGLEPNSVMPFEGEPLTPEQIGWLRAWIDQGAVWPDDGRVVDDPLKTHWAFQPVRRPPVPVAMETPAKAAHPLDAFITERRGANRLTPSPEADRVTLIRRLYFVMLGLPPTPEEVAAFFAAPEPDAFERLVDRVLDDPRYGERWARHWLDVIRFAESNGFETNRERTSAWRFRDYVIEALNRDLPYDRFIREQIAGDALGVDVATGFLVAGPVDIVGSPDPVLTAQQRADEIDDMIGTTSTAFLGLTLSCARCHSHKFDPISHREYHAMAALLSGVRHGERALPRPVAPPDQLAALDAEIQELERKLTRFIVQPETATSAGDRALRPPVNARQNEEVITPVEAKFIRFTILAASSGEPGIDELEVWAGDRNVALSSHGTKATASSTLPGHEIHQLEHLNDGHYGNRRSWISNEPGRGWVQLELPQAERLERIVWGRDREGNFGDRVATQYRIETGLTTNAWQLVASSEDREPFPGQQPKPAGPEYRFEDLPADEAEPGRRWLAGLEAAREQRKELAKPPMVYAGMFREPRPTHRFHRGDAMQPREIVPPGTLAVFNPLTLATNTPEQQRRVELANWIARPENPLTARVIVNRLWQHHFGVGLVDTPNDFGLNGARPTHPELLDWLAAELVEPGAGGVEALNGSKVEKAAVATVQPGNLSTGQPWSLKHLHRLILTSAAWRQSSAPRVAAWEVDAGNRLLWRFAPRRLEAEGIRDSLLAVSGQLDTTRGGPGFFLHRVERENVYHYHPKEAFAPAESRRMVYAFKVRMEQDGIFGAFDCPDGSLVAPRRSISTTPLQALNLFNSRFVIDQSEHFAARLRKEAGADPAAQVRRAWWLAFNREPEPVEAREAGTFVRTAGLPALCRALLNANEFLFIP